MNRQQLADFERLFRQLSDLKREIDGLASKDAAAPKEALGEIALPLIDQLLERATRFLSEAERPFSEFTRFDRAHVTLSDATIVVGQYIAAFEAQRANHVVLRYGKWYWKLSKDADDKGVEYVAVERFGAGKN